MPLISVACAKFVSEQRASGAGDSLSTSVMSEEARAAPANAGLLGHETPIEHENPGDITSQSILQDLGMVDQFGKETEAGRARSAALAEQWVSNDSRGQEGSLDQCVASVPQVVQLGGG
jgi:hypothetical protein